MATAQTIKLLVPSVEVTNGEAWPLWLTLHALTGLRHPSQGMIDQQRLALTRAKVLDATIRFSFRSARIYAQRLGVKGDARLAPAQNSPRDFPICRSMTEAAPGG